MGFVRGPRITAEAAEALRELAYRHRLDPWQVVSVLLLDSASRADLAAEVKALELVKPKVERVPAGPTSRESMVMGVHGLSLPEVREYLRHADAQ